MKRLIIDCDPGNGIPGANVDDGLALALALASPDISLELITIVAGNTPCEAGYRVARDLLGRLDVAIPIYQGAECALFEPPEPWRRVLDHRVHELQLEHLWRGVRQPPLAKVSGKNAVEAIGKHICDNPGEITLVAIGPLTNVARAMACFPQMAESVKEIVIMGGVFALDNYVKDTNFGLDPEAAHQVINSGANITLVPMDATTQTLVTHHDLDYLASIDKPLAHFVVETFRPWIDYSIKTIRLPGCWIHDALVIAWLLNKHVATGSDYFVNVELHAGATRGKSWRYRTPLGVKVTIPERAGARVHVLEHVNNVLLILMINHLLSHSSY